MKLFCYYAFHSIKNQIKKLCKTWVVGLVVACIVLGGITGYLAGSLDEESSEEVYSEIEVIDVEEIESIDKLEIAELASVAIICGIFILNLLNIEKNGLAIFQTADIGILFASPMSPAKVMLFRTFCTMGLSILLTIYYLIEIPSLMEMLSIKAFGAAALIVAVGVTIMMASLIKTLVSIEMYLSEKFKKYWLYALYALVGLAALTFVISWQQSGLDLLKAALVFFNAPNSRFIPIVGWIKGIAFYGIEGNIVLFLVELLLCVMTMALLLFLIYKSKPDYYEDAIHKSEELAELNRTRKEQGKLFIHRKTKKENLKDKTLIKDQLNYGSGAMMFFLKPLYNRYRFAKFHVFTKTLITYFLIVVVYCGIDYRFDLGMLIEIPFLIIGTMVFYRSLGNPLKEDLSSIYFRVSPLSAYQKILASLLAGEVNCLLDIFPAMLLAGIYTKTNFLSILGYMAFIITLDFYSTSGGNFVNISLPEKAGANVKQALQILFIYFGLLPDIIVFILCLIFSFNITISLLLTSIINIALSVIFISLSLPYLEPRGGICHFEGKEEYQKEGKRNYSLVGISLIVFYVITKLVREGCLLILNNYRIEYDYGSLVYYLLSMVPMYLVGLPLMLLLLKGIKEKKWERKKPSLSLVLKSIPVIALFALSGSIIGNLLDRFFCVLSGSGYTNLVNELLGSSNIWLQIIFVVLIGPFMEEFVFRKTLINKLSPYGQKLAIVASALLFGLFHATFSQMFYAAGIGLVFGYLYVQTGSMKTTFIYHATFNLINGVLLAQLIGGADVDTMNLMLNNFQLPLSIKIYLAYFVLEVLLAIVGIVILSTRNKELKFSAEEKELPYIGRIHNSILAPGMCIFMVAMLVYVIVYYFL